LMPAIRRPPPRTSPMMDGPGLLPTGAPIAVLGAGSWGTALAIQFARSGKATRLWGRDREQVAAMVRERANRRYLPQGDFPDSLSVGADLGAQLAGALDVLIVVPSDSFRAMLGEIQPLLSPRMRLAWATKGFEAHSGLLPHQVAREVLGTGRAFAVLSGPTFASEVASPPHWRRTCRPPIFAPIPPRTLSGSKSVVP
jgi:glycerol-3-phosphate dehydrogenase (NAD(P)+)